MYAIRQNVDITHLTTFRLSASAAVLATFDDINGLYAIMADSTLPKPIKTIGAGSNLIFAENFTGTLLSSQLLEIEFIYSDSQDEIYVKAGSGVEMDYLIEKTVEGELWGLENLSGIPGLVGAAPVQNVGAYGVEAKDVIETVSAYDIVNKEIKKFHKEELKFGYRTSLFKQPENKDRYIILDVTFRLKRSLSPVLNYGDLKDLKNEELTPLKVRETILSLRDTKLPPIVKYGSAGSFFKNPVITKSFYEEMATQLPHEKIPFYAVDDNHVKIPCAWLIEKCGLKGKQLGGAAIWEKQPLVIVNQTGKATSKDVIGLAKLVKEQVFSSFGITITPEVEIIGKITVTE